jgi:hypothetical protein
MRLEISYPERTWAVMPSPSAFDDEAWIAAQVAFAGESDAAHLSGHIERTAREALTFRRVGIDTSLFFRPLTVIATGVLHLTVADSGDADSDLRASDWIPDGLDPAFEPIVSEFETDYSSHGIRVAYLSASRADDGRPLAGINYGLRLDGGVATVFSELADTEVAGLMQVNADPIVASLRLVA